MRLNSFQTKAILEGVFKFCGPKAKVWLFGSRVDDSKKGGDIDLYIEVDENISLLDVKLKLLGFLHMKLGEQKIDILIKSRDMPSTAMHEIAKATGVKILN